MSILICELTYSCGCLLTEEINKRNLSDNFVCIHNLGRQNEVFYRFSEDEIRDILLNEKNGIKTPVNIPDYIRDMYSNG